MKCWNLSGCFETRLNSLYPHSLYPQDETLQTCNVCIREFEWKEKWDSIKVKVARKTRELLELRTKGLFLDVK